MMDSRQQQTTSITILVVQHVTDRVFATQLANEGFLKVHTRHLQALLNDVGAKLLHTHTSIQQTTIITDVFDRGLSQ